MRCETKRPFLVSTEILGFLLTFKKSQASSPFEALNFTSLSRCQVMWGPLSRWGGDIRLSLWSPQAIQTSLHLVRLKKCLHSSHFREIRPYFLSGNLGIHSTWGSKLWVPLTYLLLREGSSWRACGKLAYLFNKILWIICLLKTIWCAWSFPQVSVLQLVFL